MSYHVLPLTLAQVRQGALGFQRQLSVSLREARGLKVYSASPFDLEARRRMKERFGGDVVYFFNQAAWEALQGIERLLPANETEGNARRACAGGLAQGSFRCHTPAPETASQCARSGLSPSRASPRPSTEE